MPRTPRLINNDESTVYHVMSRSALDGFPLGDVEKDFMIDLIRRYSKLYLVEIMGFCLMGNHFHILMRIFPDYKFTDEDIKKRGESFYGDERLFVDGQIPVLREKLSNLSEFVREIKVSFARYYNRRHHRRGYFWGDRFKSVIVENGETLINCLAYIDLNPLRAGLVERPEAYRWNSLGYHIQTGNKDDFLSLDFGLKEFGILDTEERLKRYRRYVYEAGALNRPGNRQAKVIENDVVEHERKKGYEIKRAVKSPLPPFRKGGFFAHRCRYFTDSGIIGTKEFVASNYQRLKMFSCPNGKKPLNPWRGWTGFIR